MSRDKLNEFVDVQISRETQIIEGEDFSTVLFITDEKPFFDRMRTYGSPNAVLEDFPSDSKAYKAAVKHFSQKPRPNVLKIGGREFTETEVSFDSYIQGDIQPDTDYILRLEVKDAVTGEVTAGSFIAASGSNDYSAELDRDAEVARLIEEWETGIDAHATISGLISVDSVGDTLIITPRFSEIDSEAFTKVKANLNYVTDGILIDPKPAPVFSFDANVVLTGSTNYVLPIDVTSLTGSTVTQYSATVTSGTPSVGTDFYGEERADEIERIIEAWRTDLEASEVSDKISVSITETTITISPVEGEISSTGDDHKVVITGTPDGVSVSGTYEPWEDCVLAHLGADGGWYGLTTYTSNTLDILNIAATIESQKKLYGFSTTNKRSLEPFDIEDVSGSDTLGLVASYNYDRTFGCYHSKDDDFFEVCLMGKKLQAIAGSTTWKYTTLSAITPDPVSLGESKNIRSRSANTYERIAGQNMFQEGTVASGEFIDVIHGSDDLQSRIQTEVYRLKFVEANGGSKIALTDEDMRKIVQVVETEIRRSVTNGFIKSTVDIESASGDTTTVAGYEVFVDLVSNVSANDRAKRIAPTVYFNAVLAGAVHKTTIRGSLTV